MEKHGEEFMYRRLETYSHKVFFVKDRVDNEVVSIVYCPTRSIRNHCNLFRIFRKVSSWATHHPACSCLFQRRSVLETKIRKFYLETRLRKTYKVNEIVFRIIEARIQRGKVFDE